MKKMFFLMLLISAIGIQQVSAQTGVNNNSDYHVPPPSVPPVAQSSAGAPAVTATPLPAAPELATPVSMAQNVAANSLFPIPVEVPVAPPVPTVIAANNAVTNTVGGVTNVTTTGTTNVTLNVTPSIPAQLPISELPGLPTLNLEISTPIANTVTGGAQPAGGGVAGGLAPEVN